MLQGNVNCPQIMVLYCSRARNRRRERDRKGADESKQHRGKMRP